MNLPILKFKDQILASINDNAVTIITAETGSGKSTQVCQYLYEAGYEVIITQPRRIAAVSLANRVSEEMNNSDVVGYHTGFEKSFTDDTKILFCTDGLQLVKQLTDNKHLRSTKAPRVLIIDEVHEWNLNIETLIAWSKKKLNEHWNTKVVIMSATLNHEKLQNYLGESPVLDLPGIVYPVETIIRDERQFIDSIKEFSVAGKNILAFVPGKKEMDNTINELRDVNAIILPLHGELTMAEQKLCFKNYDKPKIIITTNIAQTSVTVPDIDVVIDTGTERRIETIDGVQGLFLKDISRADCMQRRGRAGRTRPGIYVLCGTSLNRRLEYPVPEIQRLILDQMVLRLMAVGIDATELDFFHQPNVDSIIAAKKTLEIIKAISDGCITVLGKKILEIPISVKYARMILEADKLGVVDDVITIAAILEIGSLINHRETSYRSFTDESTSDLIAELIIWNTRQGRKVNFKEECIFSKNFFRVKELRDKIIQSIENRDIVSFGSTGNKADIRKACLIGMMDNIYYSSYGEFQDGITCKTFQLDNKSCVSMHRANWAIGIPVCIEYKNRWGGSEHLEILKSVTKVDQSLVMECIPHMFSTTVSELRYDSYCDCVVADEQIKFGNIIIQTNEKEFPNHACYETLKLAYQNERSYHRSLYSIPEEKPKQKKISINGISFDIVYPYSFSWDKSNPYITLELSDINDLGETVSVRLDDGSNVDFYCIGQKSTNLQILKKNISTTSLKSQWSSLEKGLPSIKTKKCSVILNELLIHVMEKEVSDAFGNVTKAYICLETKDQKIGIAIRKSESVANELTEESLKHIIDLIVEQKYPKRNFEFKINGKYTLTPKGSKIRIQFLEFVNECKNELIKENLLEYIDLIAEYYNEITVSLQLSN